MKLKSTFSALFSLCLILIWEAGLAQESPLTGSLVVKGKIEGLNNGTVSVTTEVFGQKKIFNGTIALGRFEVKITQPSPTLYSLVVDEDQASRLLFFADNGIIQIEAVKGNMPNAKVSGSISNKEFNQYNALIADYDAKLSSIQQVYADLGQAGTLLPKQDSLENIFKLTLAQKDEAIQLWIRVHQKSFVSPLVMILNYANDGDPAMMRPLFNGFTADVKKSYYGNFLEGQIAKLEDQLKRAETVNIGKTAPLFSQADPLGKSVSLESFRGKYVLIDFWASWCGPCRQENPNLVRTYQKFKSRNLEILGVSLDNDKDRWLEAIKKDQLTWAQVSDLKYWRNDVALQYGVQSIPANFLLDKEGKIIAKGLRGPALEQALEKLLVNQ